MKVAVLTTETTHHTFFVQEVSKICPVESVVLERKIVYPPFETHHPFEDSREAYEREAFFQGKDTRLSDIALTFEVDSVNDPDSRAYLEKLSPGMIIVFGTGKIHKEIIQICPDRILNLHGGDPEEYRGLDSHLWAIYHNDFKALVTTLHHINEELDDGPIVLQTSIPLNRGTQLYELRRYNTMACIDMVRSVFDMYHQFGRTLSRPQRRRGRYYSLMPAALKEVCQARFKEYTDRLP